MFLYIASGYVNIAYKVYVEVHAGGGGVIVSPKLQDFP